MSGESHNSYSNLYTILSGLIATQFNVYSRLSGSLATTNIITVSGNGQSFLANDGTYKPIDLSILDNFVESSSLYDSGTTVIKASHLPSYVDDVVEGYIYNGLFYSDSSHNQALPTESSKIYVDLASNDIYRWGGSQFVCISDANAYIGEINERISELSAIALTGRLSGLTVTQEEKDIWNAKGSSNFTGDYNDLINKPNISDIQNGTSIDYLLFKIPNNTEPTVNYDLKLTFSSSDSFSPQSSLFFQQLYDSGRFVIGNSSQNEFISTSNLGAGIPYNYSNDILRFDLSSLKENSTTSGYTRFSYQWIAKDLVENSEASGVVGFGMLNGSVQIFDNDFTTLNETIEDIQDDITELSTAITNIGPGGSSGRWS